MRQEVEALTARPRISLVMPTYKTELRYLRQAVESVLGQHYPDWELCIVDDGSDDPELHAAIQRYADADPRIEFEPLPENQGISTSSNEGLAMCHGEFVGFLDHDDTLTPDALLRVAQALAADPELDVVYSDSDKLTLHGIRADPFLKPDWSPVYALGAMYIGHLLVVRRSIAEATGGFDPAFDKIQDFEFMLRVSERTDRIHHIPQVLYHWRAIPGSIAAGTDQKGGVRGAAGKGRHRPPRAIGRGRGRRAPPAHSPPGGARSLQWRRPLRRGAASSSRQPRRARASTGCSSSLLELTAYPRLETIVVAPDGKARGDQDEGRVTWITAEPGPFRSERGQQPRRRARLR